MNAKNSNLNNASESTHHKNKAFVIGVISSATCFTLIFFDIFSIAQGLVSAGSIFLAASCIDLYRAGRYQELSVDRQRTGLLLGGISLSLYFCSVYWLLYLESSIISIVHIP